MIYYINDGSSVQIDEEDLDLLNQYTWSPSGNGYASGKLLVGRRGRKWGIRRSGKPVFMHRLVMGASSGMTIDHINQDKSDNRKSNLRPVTKSQNQSNMPSTQSHSSKYKGVGWDTQKRRWSACVKLNGKTTKRFFKEEFDAATAYNFMAEFTFGEFAVYNVT